MKILGFAFVLIFWGCTKVNFTANAPVPSQEVQAPVGPIAAPSPTPAPVKCVKTIDQTTENLRIIFMVDNSGSTLDTDPNQQIRVQTIRNFIAKYGMKANFTYSFGFFSDDTYFYNTSTKKFIDVSRSGISSIKFGASGDLVNALNSFNQIDGFGGTNYSPALGAVSKIISQDPASKENWNYIVIFMSDGQPSDILDPVIDHLKSLVDLVTVAAHSHKALATMSTVLFDPIHDSQYPSSSDNLKYLAKQGKGQYFDTNFPPAGGLAIDDIISVPGEKCSQD